MSEVYARATAARAASGVLGVVRVPAGGFVADTRLADRPLVSFARSAIAVVTERSITVTVGEEFSAELREIGTGLDRMRFDPLVGIGELDGFVEAATHILLHDSRCPLISPTELLAVLSRCPGGVAAAAVGVRPVTDTIKSVDAGTSMVTGTVDREALVAVCAPLALSREAIDLLTADVGQQWWEADLWVLVDALRRHIVVELVELSASARRVDDEDAVRLLAAYAVPV